MSKYARIIDIEKLLYRKGFCIGKTPDELYEALSDLETIEVSEDCISREFTLEVISDYVNYPTEGDKVCAIKNAPSVVPTTEQSSKVGEWIEVDDGRVSCKCSICKEEYLLYEEDVFGRNYCPNCGTKMKGVNE